VTSASPSEFRLRTAQETYDCVHPLLEALGITRVASQTGLDHVGLPVWCAYVPNAKAIVIAQGKGVDDETARISAVMEAVERVIATNPECPRRLASAAQLSSEGQRVHRLNPLIARHQLPVTDTEEIFWVEGLDLLRSAAIWLPFEAVDFDRTRLNPRFWQSSDGLASGNTADEAVLHGLLERIERDALALWTVSSTRSRFSRRINPSQFTSCLLAVFDRIEKAGLQIALFDVTTDLQIPAVAALLAPRELDRRVRYVEVTLGAGAGLTPEAAILRAMLEAVQSRMTFIAGARDDLVPSLFQRLADPGHFAAFRSVPAVEISQMPSYCAGSTAEALSLILKHLQSKGISDLFAVDLGPAHLPVRVVRVFAPQLENPDGARRIRFGPRALSQSLR
jgi:YcaO-like protein with predicted kinase domain